MKLKLQPSSRVKHRYLLLEAESKKDIEQAIIEGIGTLGWAKAAPLFVEQKSKNFIFAITRESINAVRASIELSPIKIKILRVSGTLKGLT